MQTGSLVVLAPQGGQLVNIGVKTSWPEGHLPTVRAVVQRWKTAGQVTFDSAAYGQMQQPVQLQRPVLYQQPMYQMPLFSFRAGGC